MEISSKISYSSPTPCVVALGCFDGVHLGHASVINKAVKIAKEMSLPCLVFTFEEPPRNLFSPEPTPLLTLPEKKAELISSLRADILVCTPFTADIAALTPEQFSNDILLKNLKAAHIVCGFNYSFGKLAKGNTEFLNRFCAENNIGLSIIPPFELDCVCVSSSLIRELIANGEIEKANLLLGRNYSLCAEVVGDKGLARSLGFATANQIFDKKTLMPKNGVYATQTTLDGITLRGITNIGTRPTVNGNKLCAETHLFDFCGDLYGKNLEIELLKFIRPERKFNSVEELKNQVLEDIQIAKKI